MNSNWRWRTRTNYKPDEDNLHNIWMSYHPKKWATHERYHDFTAPTWLGAKEPDHLTTCNTVESKKRLLLKGQPCRKRPEMLHERDSCAKKHRTQHLLSIRIGGGFNSHRGGELDLVKMTVSKLTPEWKHEILSLYKNKSRPRQDTDWMSCQRCQRCQRSIEKIWTLELWIQNYVGIKNENPASNPPGGWDDDT